MNQADAVQLLKEDTAQVPAGARERVWRRLGTEVPARSTPFWLKGLAFAACTAAGFALVSSLSTPAPVTFQLDRAVASATGSVTRDATGALHVEKGEVVASAWGTPGIKITASSAQVEAEAAIFSVSAAAQAVVVDVNEGEVRVNGERVEAGHRWPKGTAAQHDYARVTKLEPAHAAEDRSWALADRDVESGRFPQALARYDALGGSGLRAEAALLKKGELQLRQLKSPADALLTFQAARRRFPSGSLGQELSLSSLEAMLALEQWSDARAAARDFLSQFPDSERQVEVRYVSALAAWRVGDKPAACSELSGLQPSAFSGERRETLEKLASQCTFFER
jgi:hypothetical protein